MCLINSIGGFVHSAVLYAMFMGKGRVKSFFLFSGKCIAITMLVLDCAFAQSVTDPEPRRPANPDSLYRVLKNGLDLATQQGNAGAEGDYLHQLGTFFYHQGNYVRATANLLQAIKKYPADVLPGQLAGTHHNLGVVYFYNRQPVLARRQFELALQLYTRAKDPSGIARVYGSIGQVYEKKGDLDSARIFERLALRQYAAAKDNKGLAKIFENIGSIFEDQALYDSARTYFSQALMLNQQNGDLLAQIEVIDNLGDIARKTGRYPEALRYYRQAKQLATVNREKYQLNSIYRDLAKTYRLMQQPDSVIAYLELSHDLSDEIYTIENNRQIALMQTLYEVEQKNNEIIQLNAAKRIDMILLLAAVLVIVLTGVLAFLYSSRQRLKLRNQQALHEQNNRIFDARHELVQAELKNRQLEEESLKKQLELKSQSLSTHTLHLIQKNQMLDELKNELTMLVRDEKRDQKKQLRQVIQKINLSFSQDDYWEEFRTVFDQVHQEFVARITQAFPNLTAYDLRVIALLKMNINSADMATLLGITPDSLRVARYRLRKKINLKEGDSLTAFVRDFE